MNNTQVQHTRVNTKPQTESASSRIDASLPPPIARDIVAKIENEILFKKILIIMGSIKTAMVISAITPQEFLISERLDVTVRKASFTDEPTNGTKLLIANLAVLSESVSAPCDNTFLYESTNINIDITNTVTDVKVVLIVLEIPLKSISLFIDFEQPKARHIFVRGIIKAIKNPSIMLINKSIEPFEMIAVEIFPLIVSNASISGVKALIIEHKIFIYSVALVTIIPQMLNTAIEIHSVEHIEKTSWRLLFEKEELRECKIDIMIIKTSMDAKLLITTFKPETKYVEASSKNDFSPILPFVKDEKSPLKISFGKKSFTYSGKASLNEDSSSSMEI